MTARIDDFGEISEDNRNTATKIVSQYRDREVLTDIPYQPRYSQISFIDMRLGAKLIILVCGIIGTLVGYEVGGTMIIALAGLFWGLWIILAIFIILGNFYEDIFAMTSICIIAFGIGFFTLLGVGESINFGLISGFTMPLVTYFILKLVEYDQ